MSRRWKKIKGTPAENHPSVFVLIGPDKEVRKTLMARLLDHVVNGGSVSEHMRQTVAILSTFEEAEKNRLQYLNAWASERALDTSLESLEGFMEWGRVLGYVSDEDDEPSPPPTSQRAALSSGSRASRSRSASQPVPSSRVSSCSSSRPVVSSSSSSSTQVASSLHAVSSSQPPTTSSSSLEISKRAAIKPRWKKLPEATQSYVASLASLTPLEESLLDADSVTRAQILLL